MHLKANLLPDGLRVQQYVGKPVIDQLYPKVGQAGKRRSHEN